MSSILADSASLAELWKPRDLWLLLLFCGFDFCGEYHVTPWQRPLERSRARMSPKPQQVHVTPEGVSSSL